MPVDDGLTCQSLTQQFDEPDSPLFRKQAIRLKGFNMLQNEIADSCLHQFMILVYFRCVLDQHSAEKYDEFRICKRLSFEELQSNVPLLLVGGEECLLQT